MLLLQTSSCPRQKPPPLPLLHPEDWNNGQVLAPGLDRPSPSEGGKGAGRTCRWSAVRPHAAPSELFPCTPGHYEGHLRSHHILAAVVYKVSACSSNSPGFAGSSQRPGPERPVRPQLTGDVRCRERGKALFQEATRGRRSVPPPPSGKVASLGLLLASKDYRSRLLADGQVPEVVDCICHEGAGACQVEHPAAHSEVSAGQAGSRILFFARCLSSALY